MSDVARARVGAGAPAGGRRLPYHPGLDGLRAICVVAVVAYHLGWIRGGFLGVDGFFVLSGYLITSLLVAEQARGRIRLAAFWSRRARRLLPALIVMITVVMVVARTTVPRADVLGTIGYVANWQHIWSHASYFDQFAAPSPLRHTWSLAVEEQFYLVWPLVVVVAYRIGGRRALIATCVAGIAASAIVTALWYNASDPSRVYYGTDSRAQLLLVGALLALLPTVRAPQWLGFAALGFCVAAMVFASDHTVVLYHGGLLLNAVFVAVVLASVVSRPNAVLARTLGFGPLRSLGKVSYGVYLWSWPVIVLCTTARTGFHGPTLDLVRLVLIALATVISYQIIEMPVRRVHWTPHQVLGASGVAIASIAAFAVVVVPRAHVSRVFASDGPRIEELARRTAPRPAPELHPDATPLPPPSREIRRVAVIGDSVAASLASGLDEVSGTYGVEVVRRALPGCGVAGGFALDDEGHPFGWSEQCLRAVPANLDDVVTNVDPDVVVWLSWLDPADRREAGQRLTWGSAAHRQALLASMDEEVQRLTARGARVVFVAPAPPAPGDLHMPYPSSSQRRTEGYRRLLFDYVATHPAQTATIDLQALVCPGGYPCPVEIDGVRLRPDGLHFSASASPVVARRLLPLVLAAARAG